MNTSIRPASLDSGTDARLAELVEELTNKLHAGEPVDVSAWASQYPEHYEQLQQLLPALQVLAELGSSAGSPDEGGASRGQSLASDTLEAGVLGDFRIIREIGRGGMGVVYEAEQISLERRVALKVLPFAGTMDPRALQRFQNEARAAASLHHTNIVPVFAVGCERGVHYFAMQMIDGHTLAAVIQQMRQAMGLVPAPEAPAGDPSPALINPSDQPTSAYRPPPGPTAPATQTTAQAALTTEGSARGPAFFRRAAELGIQAAEALEHAHQLGVVHRDVKPSNLMIDGRGTLWVTDFGLARLPNDPGMTMTGDLIGTLRYMSPEQALAKRVIVDQRTDIYSLGVTLYELLTLHHVYAGNDRQELLRQIAFEQPRAPRRLNRAIPAELETIVLKAIEKNPADRYGTAQELADDLRRFLEDQPIHARRPTWAKRAAKWARRHKPVVWAATVVLVVAAILAGGAGVWWAQRSAADEREAEIALEETQRLQDEEKWPEALLVAHRSRPLLSAGFLSGELRERMEERIADLEMVARLEEIRMLQAEVKDGKLDGEKANRAYRDAFKDYGIDVLTLPREQAAGLIRAKEIRMQLTAALDEWAGLIFDAKQKGWDTTRRDLVALTRVSDSDPWRSQIRDAVGRRDQDLMKNLAKAEHADKVPASSLNFLASILEHEGAFTEALALLRKAQHKHPSDFLINYTLARNLFRMKSWEESIRFMSAAQAIRPKNPWVYYSLGLAFSRKEKWDAALVPLQDAIRLDPGFADAHILLAYVLIELGSLDAALDAAKIAVRLDPGNGAAHSSLANVLIEKGSLDAALDAAKIAVRLDPKLAGAHSNLGRALNRKGAFDEAIDACKTAIRLDPKLGKAFLALGIAQYGKGAFDEAIAAFKEAIGLNPKYVEAHCNLGRVLTETGALNEAIGACKVAIRLAPKMAGAHCNLGDALSANGALDDAIFAYKDAIRLDQHNYYAHNNLGVALIKKGVLDEAIVAFKEAIRINPKLGLAQHNLRNAEHTLDLERKLPEILDGRAKPKDPAESIILACLCQEYKKFFVAAARFYSEAFKAEPKLAEAVDSHRYNAACAAALAGGGQGKDSAQLDEAKRAFWRRQALEWLRGDLKLWTTILEGRPTRATLNAAVKSLAHWQRDEDFAYVRGDAAITKLPEAERKEWRQLWADVAKTLAKAREKAGLKETGKKKP